MGGRVIRIGKYQASCDDDYCMATGQAGRSKIEGHIYALLSNTLGTGKRNERIFVGERWFDVDMVFTLRGEPGPRAGKRRTAPTVRLIVEYDGAYFHRGREWADLSKTEALMSPTEPDPPMLFQVSPSLPTLVIRIRESPLVLLDHTNVGVPPKGAAHISVQATLLHLWHLLDEWHGPAFLGLRTRIGYALLAAADRVEYEQVTCSDCRYVHGLINEGPQYWAA